ncbi:MAG TPA: nickel pincer cofactor biosynthesis protein LarC [Candidatus Acidoferrales bacterium]|nr:nickel pincer cofactor biosynthesis protein LarC [Candidatus Acidoferrales bacterium]
MRIAYGDLISGISGDMFVAALLDAGVSLPALRAGLKRIDSLDFRLKVTQKTVHGVRATHFQVLRPAAEKDRTWKEIQLLIRRSSLPALVKERSLEVFRRLAEAEAKIHGVAVERVHFHEIGATDSIVDIVAAAIGVHRLGIESFSFSPVPLGRGLAGSRHGALPVPAPATLALLEGVPTEGIDVAGETVTPTGAAILAALGSRFGPPPPMTIEKVGYGAGTREFPARPNLFRLIVGQSAGTASGEAMVVLETNIDDMNPEIYDHVFDRLFKAGARDVFLTPIQMKKNRPGIMLSIIAEPWQRDKLAEVVFRETSTIGLRYYPVSRTVLKRAVETVKTKFGPVRMKIVEEPGGAKRAVPEYDDLKQIAARKNIPLRVLYDEVLRAFKPARSKR